jgi:dolichol-phosphate mannosyltransferase
MVGSGKQVLIGSRVASRPAAGRPLFSLVVPTLNEAENLPSLVRWLERSLRKIPHEIIVVDDSSSDGTADVAERLATRYPTVRVERRSSDLGLSAAIVHGFRKARGAFLGVIDADLQHDARIVPELIAALADHDIAIGSRYALRGRTCRWSWLREAESRLAATFTRWFLRIPLKDPLSGFFALRREVFETVVSGLSSRGWKVLLEILAHAPGARVVEVPYTFYPRRQGTTKMNGRVVTAWLRSLFELRRARRRQEIAQLGRPLPGRVALP